MSWNWRVPVQRKVSVWRNCPACDGTGKKEPLLSNGSTGYGGEELEYLLLVAQGLCLACKGKGGQYFDVLEGSPDAPKATLPEARVD